MSYHKYKVYVSPTKMIPTETPELLKFKIGHKINSNSVTTIFIYHNNIFNIIVTLHVVEANITSKSRVCNKLTCISLSQKTLSGIIILVCWYLPLCVIITIIFPDSNMCVLWQVHKCIVVVLQCLYLYRIR